MKDIITSRGADFVTRNASATNWNKGTTEFVLRGKKIRSTEEALKIIYKQMRHRAISLGHANIPIEFDAKGSYTDLKTVWVGLDFIHDEGFTSEQKVDIAKGLLSHEIAHVKYTCAKTKRAWQNDLMREDYNITDSQLFRDIANILEDERIETNLIKQYRGVADDIAIVKKRYFGKVVEFNPQGAIQDQIVLLLYVVRFPSSIPQELIDAYPEFYEFICERLSDLYNKTRLTAKKDYQHILEASLDVYKALRTEDEEGNSQTHEEAKDKAREDYEKKCEEAREKTQEKVEKRREFEEQMNQINSEQSEDESDEEKEERKQKLKDIEKEFNEIVEEERKLENEAHEIRQKIRNPFGSGGVLGSIDEKTEEDEKKFREIKSENNLDEICERGKFTKQVVKVCKPHSKEYSYAKQYELNDEKVREHHNNIKPLMAPLRKAMALQFECRSRRVNNLRSGKIRNLVGAHQGRQDVFSRAPRIKQDKLNLAILIDQSGSMSGYKMEIARDFAMLFYQTFHNSPNVNLWMYGLRCLESHSDARTEEFYSPNSKGEFLDRFKGMIADGGNDDGHNIMTLADLVRADNDEPCVMVCISDGDPSDKDYLKYSVKAIQSRGFHPIQIGIGTNYEDKGNKFFDEWAEVNYKEIDDVEYGRSSNKAQLRDKTIRKFSQVVRTKIASALA